MKSRKFWRLAGALIAFALVAAACGSSDDDTTATSGDDTETTEAADETTEAADESADGDEAMADGEMGINADNVLVGPSGFSIDLNECPSDWSDTDGLTDDEIKLGVSTAQSGTVAAFGQIAVGSENHFNYINENEGGIGGRQLTYSIKDDAYEPARTVGNIQELIDQDGVFAFASVLGTPPNLAVYDTINDECIPQLFNATGHPAWGDPVNHPWTTGLQLAYNTEAILWGQYIVDNFEGDKPATVAALVMNNDFGLSYEAAFQAFAEEHPDDIEIAAIERHDPSAPNITNELTTLAATDADIIILMTTSVYCTQSFEGVQEAAWDPAIKIVSATCQGIESFFKPAGDAGVGWILTGGIKDITDPSFADDPFFVLAREELEKAGLDPNVSQFGNGWIFGWSNTEALKRANELPGGLTRTNLVLAARTVDTEHPGLIDGITYRTDGAVDGYPIEGTVFHQYELEDGAEIGTHVPIGEPLDLNGESPNCAWGEDPINSCEG